MQLSSLKLSGRVPTVALSALVALSASACSKNGSNADAGMPATCATPTGLQIVFSPMYSAYDGTHMFQVPAIVLGIDPNLVKWGSSDEKVATIATDSVVGGGMVTVTGAGQANIIASAGSLCGSATLTVDSATPAQWMAGNDRYNNGVTFGRQHGDAGVPDGGLSTTDPACTNCHGPTANGAFMDVAHTPEQIGGFSDEVLANIMQNGMVPDGGYFDPQIVPYRIWQRFHHWQMTSDDVKGVIIYLRSLTPTPQNGTSNFGGQGPGPRPDGGFGHGPHDGGFGHGPHDGGAPRD
jgi:hypothetical protein